MRLLPLVGLIFATSMASGEESEQGFQDNTGTQEKIVKKLNDLDDRLRDVEAMLSLNKVGDFRLEEKMDLLKKDMDMVMVSVSSIFNIEESFKTASQVSSNWLFEVYKTFNGKTKLLVSTDSGMRLINNPLVASLKPNCGKLPENPIISHGMVGGIIGGKVILCGGYDEKRFFSSCHYLSGSTWQELNNMPIQRTSAASVMIEDGWWITGGYNGQALSSTHILDPTTLQWSTGPDLPKNLTRHCITKINSTHVFLTGGNDGTYYSHETYIYSRVSNTWTKMASMSHRRHMLSCHLRIDRRGILVVGGFEGQRSLATVESFDLTTMKWRTLQNLPTHAQSATFVQDGDDLILVNPYEENIMRWNEQEEVFTVIPGMSTGVTGHSSTVVAVSHKDIPGC